MSQKVFAEVATWFVIVIAIVGMLCCTGWIVWMLYRCCITTYEERRRMLPNNILNPNYQSVTNEIV